MNQVTIENPVLNSPFEEPKRHFKFTEDGITDKIIEERWISQYFVPIPQPKKKSAKQLAFAETGWTADRVEENKDINRIRERVAIWRKGEFACWFIDTDYNEETFIVRHAYFTGADEPYDKLKRALRTEIDESAWSALYTNESIPFKKPAHKGKIAVKVINHYGDEVLKVYEM